MTNYEFIKQASAEQLTKFLCFVISMNENAEDACGECFASNECFIGQNGIGEWLSSEYEGMKI